MSLKTAILMVFVIIIVAMGVKPVAAQRTVGVSVGLSTESSCVYSGNMTLPPPDQRLEWIKVTVQEVSGTDITFQQIMRYADMHEDKYAYYIDVESGQGQAGSFIAANLNKGDLIYTSPSIEMFQGATINETVFREYLGASIEVNHLNLTIVETVPGEGTTIGSINFYWNKATGACFELVFYQFIKPEAGEAIWGEMRWKIINLREVFHVVFDSVDYPVAVGSNYTIADFAFSQPAKQISFNVTGPTGETGYCNVTIPNNLLWATPTAPWVILVDSLNITYTWTENATHTSLYFTFEFQSTHTVTVMGTGVVPEFPLFLILPALSITTLMAVIVARKMKRSSEKAW